ALAESPSRQPARSESPKNLGPLLLTPPNTALPPHRVLRASHIASPGTPAHDALYSARGSRGRTLFLDRLQSKNDSTMQTPRICGRKPALPFYATAEVRSSRTSRVLRGGM